MKLYRIDRLYVRARRISYRASVLIGAGTRDTARMSETINIKRYRLAYGGAHEAELRRWKLRRVPDHERGTAGTGKRSAAAAGDQGSCAMYASPART
jgi:hypothetical protein